MSDDLLSLRVMLLSPERGLHDLFRQAAATCPVPIEIDAADGRSGRPQFAGDPDIAYLDSQLPAGKITQVVASLRASAKPPFTIQLAASAAAQAFAADAVAAKPSRPEQAAWLLERSVRVRLPSRALIVDDSSTMRAIVRKTLAATRFPLDVSEADAGLAALDRVRSGAFHIVILDYNMPGLSGLDTLAEFKRENREISVVLMTSAQGDAVARKARDMGAAFLRKPFFPADLEAVLCRFYGLRELNPNRA